MYLTQSPKAAFRIINGEAVIVDVSTSMLYSLNSLATLIWEVSDSKTTVKDIVDKIEKEYEVEREVAEKDCIEFVNDFIGKGLLTKVEDLKEV
jgi:hypothetical protein